MALFMPVIGVSAQSFRDSVELEPIVVTASHTPKALKDAPVVTRLITLHDIKITDATNIQDLLIQEIPGLEFGFAMSQETALHMSGFGGNAVLFLVDGERLSGETMDNTDYNRLNLDHVGRVEIVKGASSEPPEPRPCRTCRDRERGVVGPLWLQCRRRRRQPHQSGEPGSLGGQCELPLQYLRT